MDNLIVIWRKNEQSCSDWPRALLLPGMLLGFTDQVVLLSSYILCCIVQKVQISPFIANCCCPTGIQKKLGLQGQLGYCWRNLAFYSTTIWQADWNLAGKNPPTPTAPDPTLSHWQLAPPWPPQLLPCPSQSLPSTILCLSKRVLSCASTPAALC